MRHSIVVFVCALLALSTTNGGEVMRLAQHEYAVEVHPGPRPGCGRCAEMATRMRGFSGEILVPKGGSVYLTRAWANDAGARNALILANHSRDDRVGLERLAEAPKKLVVVHDIPTSSEMVYGMHGIDATIRQLVELQELEGQLPKLLAGANSIYDLKKSDGDVATSLRRTLAERKVDELTIVLSHVSKGNLRFHDGSSIPLEEIESLGNVFVIGCRTYRVLEEAKPGLLLGFDRSLTYQGGAQSAELILQQIKHKGTLRDALLLLQNEFPGSDRAKARKDENEGLRTFESPADSGPPAKDDFYRNERDGAASPAIGIVKAGVIGIGVGDGRGNYLARQQISRPSTIQIADSRSKESGDERR
jgi:hypothetical protein